MLGQDDDVCPRPSVVRQPASERRGDALDSDEIEACLAIPPVAVEAAGRSSADYRNRTARRGHHVYGCPMIVTVKDKFGTRSRQQIVKALAVNQPARARGRHNGRRMVDQDDPKEAGPPQGSQRCLCPVGLLTAELPRGHERRGRDRGREPHHGNIAQAANEREGDLCGNLITPHESGPVSLEEVDGRFDVGVVIAGDRSHTAWIAEAGEPARRPLDLIRKTDIHQIAGDRDMVGPQRVNGSYDLLKAVCVPRFGSVQSPVDIADAALVQQVTEPWRGKSAKVGVR